MIKKLLQSKYSLAFLAVFIVLLYISLNKVIVPFIMKATDSSLFVEPAREDEQLGKVSNERTMAALNQCKSAMKTDGLLSEQANFADNTYEAWALGNGSYVIRSSVTLTEAGKDQVRKSFACKIQYQQGDISDINSWTIMGIDFNSEAENEGT